MRWLLVDVTIVVVAVGFLGLTALGVWRKIRTVRTAAGELKERAVALGEQTTALSERLDAFDVAARAGRQRG